MGSNRAIALEIAPPPKGLGWLLTAGGAVALLLAGAMLIMTALGILQSPEAAHAFGSAPEASAGQMTGQGQPDGSGVGVILLLALCGCAVAALLFGIGILLAQHEQRLLVFGRSAREPVALLPRGIQVRQSTRDAWLKN